MRHITQAEKIHKKRQAWLERTMRILNLEQPVAEQLLATSRVQSVRINTLRKEQAEPHSRHRTQGRDVASNSFLGTPYPWMSDGYQLKVPVADIRDTEEVVSGEWFIQNASSWLPVLALGPQAGERILDVCAAPGGKTSHIAALTDNKASIYANDNSRVRLGKLRANMERLNVRIAEYTLYDATQLSRKLSGRYFDKILLDAPCSGEGLMNILRDADFATWSVAHIKRLEQLQRRLLQQAWQLLAPGGTLVYSTCTMAPEENEAVIDYHLRKHPDARVLSLTFDVPNKVSSVREWNGTTYREDTAKSLRLLPSPYLEAFFVCKLQKATDAPKTQRSELQDRTS